jgi:hypothetical protein
MNLPINNKITVLNFGAKTYNKFPINNPIQEIIIGFLVDLLNKHVS